MITDDDVEQMCRLFTAAARDEIERAGADCQVQVVAEGGSLDPDPGVDCFYLIAEGVLELRVSLKGEETVVAYLSEGQFLGAKVLEAPPATRVAASRETRLIRIPSGLFRRLMGTYSDTPEELA
jgi:CRP-like cAMP-binding protein